MTDAEKAELSKLTDAQKVAELKRLTACCLSIDIQIKALHGKRDRLSAKVDWLCEEVYSIGTYPGDP